MAVNFSAIWMLAHILVLGKSHWPYRLSVYKWMNLFCFCLFAKESPPNNLFEFQCLYWILTMTDLREVVLVHMWFHHWVFVCFCFLKYMLTFNSDPTRASPRSDIQQRGGPSGVQQGPRNSHISQRWRQTWLDWERKSGEVREFGWHRNTDVHKHQQMEFHQLRFLFIF